VNFKPELCELILSGRKTVTRRPVSDNPRSPWWRERCSLEHGWEVGADYAVCPGRDKAAVGRILLTARPERQWLGAITNSEAVLEGFSHRGEFVTYWERLYGEFNRGALVWRVAFRIVSESGDAA
jgi:hypothetical protein